MNSESIGARRAAALFAFAVCCAGIAVFSCSSDPVNSLGSDSDVLGSEPGVVFQDTIGVFADTTYTFETGVATQLSLEIGRDSLYTHTMILQPGFATLTDHPGDTLRTVNDAYLHLFTGNVNGSYPVRFYRLGYKYDEGDPITGLDMLTDADAIADTIAGTIDRNLEPASQVYPIPRSLLQRWIRYSNTREAIAVVYTTMDRRVAAIPSRESDDGPYLNARFTDGIQRSYFIRDDATAYRPLTTTTNLIVSDGYPRRVYFRAQLDSLASNSAVHSARVKFHIVPGTLRGNYTKLILYIPDSTDPASADFKNGQRITETTIDDTSETLEFPMTNAIFLVLQGTLKDNGFAIRFADENTELRQVELYDANAADSLRPEIYVTSSTPAVFN